MVPVEHRPFENALANNQDPETITGERVKQRGPFQALDAAAPVPTMPEMQAGTVVKHYEFIRPIGAGGMGTVFLARDTRLGRLVAVKVLTKYTGPAAFRFLEEARTTAQCRHENIVVIYDVDEYDGCPYMVLEYIAGRTLREVLPEYSADAARFAVETLLPVTRALVCAHEMGIVHRDLKPENILVSNDGQIKVLDFGIAKHVSEALPKPVEFDSFWTDDNQLPQTKDGALVGTLAYMSPEQLLGETVDARTDIWAAGVILYEIVAGQRPVKVISYTQIIDVMRTLESLPSIREKCPDLGPLASIIDRCLKKNKDERFSSAKELLAALDLVAAEKTKTTLGEDESPFAGLSAFQESDAARFFGRDADIAATLTKLRHHELIAVTGPSGAGKSSFVRAGILPALKQSGKPYETWAVRPGRRPLAALAEVLAFFADTGATGDVAADSDPEVIAEILRTQPGYLGSKLRARCRKRGLDNRIVLFVDQFEELYTLGADAAERTAFCACLEGVADDASSPLRVIVTIRADFLDRLTDDRRFLASMTRGLVFLPPMGPDGLRDALEKPLEAVRYQFGDTTLVDEMLEGLSGTKSPLPILQFTATKLWDGRDRQRRLLTRDAYQRLGGVAGALSTHADAVLASLSSAEQRLVRAIFLRLVTVERTRAIVSVDELRSLSDDAAAVDQVITHLADARLLAIESSHDGGEKTVELTHESLIDRWDKLRQWLDDNQQHAQFLAELRNAAQQWEKNGEAEGLLWRDRAALEAGQWLARARMENGADGTIELGKREQRYLEAVVRLAERTRRRRQQFVAVIVTAISVFAVVVSVLAIRARDQARRADEQAQRADEQAKRADERANEAEEGARRARNATRLAAANAHQSNPTTVLALLREIEPGRLPRQWSELVRWAGDTGVAKGVFLFDSAVQSAAFSPDGRRIVSALRDRTVRVWNTDGTGEPLVLRGHEDEVYGVAFSPDGQRIVSASTDKTVRVWNANGIGRSLVLRGHEERVLGVAFSPDGQRIVSASTDKTVRVWNADGTGQPLILRGHEERVLGVAFSPDGQRIVSASTDKTVRVWNADGTGQPLILRGHGERVLGAAFSPDGRRIVSASADKTVRVWNADGTGLPLILRGHEEFVQTAVFSPDGRRIVSASGDKTVRVWNNDGTGRSLILRGHDDHISGAEFSPDGQRIVSASLDKTVRVWNADRTGLSLVLRGHEAEVYGAAFSPDGQHVVSASRDKTVRVWNADGTREPLILRGHEATVYGAMFSPDGQHVVSASPDKTARVWTIDGTDQPIVLRGHDEGVFSAAFSPDGRQIVSASPDKTLRVWNADGTGQPLVLRGHDDAIHSAAFSPDGRQIVSTSADKTLRVWNADGTGQPLVLRGHDDDVYGAAFSPDGQRIVSASFDKTVRVWNADGTGQPLVLRGHSMLAGVLGDRPWSPDGTRIVSSSDDGTVRIWNVDGTGEPIVVRLSDKPVNTASFSPDGRSIVAGLDDQTVVIVSDLDLYSGAADPRLWTATSYCMPLEVRKTLLGFSDEQSRADLERCQQNVEKARKVAPTAN